MAAICMQSQGNKLQRVQIIDPAAKTSPHPTPVDVFDTVDEIII
jgi:hypothetical protein